MSKPADTYQFLPSQMADHLGNLQIGVTKRMDVGLQGRHRSSTFGSSVEFAEYREYMQGDPIERIDWNVYARTDRYVIRRFHDEVNIRANVFARHLREYVIPEYGVDVQDGLRLPSGCGFDVCHGQPGRFDQPGHL